MGWCVLSGVLSGGDRYAVQVCVCMCAVSGVQSRGVLLPCDLSHHTIDVTCLLSLHQLRMNTSEATFIVLLGQVTCHWPMA